jgi:hypothetical protein
MRVDGGEAQLHRFFVVVHRLIVVAGVPMDEGAITQEQGIARFERKRLVEVCKRVAIVAVSLVRDCALVARRWASDITLSKSQLLPNFFCQRDLAACNTLAYTIDTDRRVQICQCALVIILVEEIARALIEAGGIARLLVVRQPVVCQLLGTAPVQHGLSEVRRREGITRSLAWSPRGAIKATSIPPPLEI